MQMALVAFSVVAILLIVCDFAKNGKQTAVLFYIKRLVIYLLSFLNCIILLSGCILVFYMDMGELLKSMTTVNPIDGMRSFFFFFFNVYSELTSFQIIVLSSFICSFGSCLALAVGCVVYYVFKPVINALCAVAAKAEDLIQAVVLSVKNGQAFKVNLKYNS